MSEYKVFGIVLLLTVSAQQVLSKITVIILQEGIELSEEKLLQPFHICGTYKS